MSFPEKLFRARAWSALNSLDASGTSPESREDRVQKDLTRRLKSVCENLSSADFEALIVKMTREQLRGEGMLGRKVRPC
jgi:hypothetical protein